MSRRGGDVPGALLAAGVFVGPVGTAEGATGAVDLVLALRYAPQTGSSNAKRNQPIRGREGMECHSTFASLPALVTLSLCLKKGCQNFN